MNVPVRELFEVCSFPLSQALLSNKEKFQFFFTDEKYGLPCKLLLKSFIRSVINECINKRIKCLAGQYSALVL